MLTPVMNYPCHETKSGGEKTVTRNGYGRERLEVVGIFRVGFGGCIISSPRSIRQKDRIQELMSSCMDVNLCRKTSRWEYRNLRRRASCILDWAIV